MYVGTVGGLNLVGGLLLSLTFKRRGYSKPYRVESRIPLNVVRLSVRPSPKFGSFQEVFGKTLVRPSRKRVNN